MSAGRVIVVGGGVIGAACAHYLVREGATVTIVDRGKFGSECSHANCGFVCPSHVLPLAAPGAVRTGIKALLNPSGAFTIKPRLDPALWSWLFRFARRCNHADMLRAGHAIQALLKSSRDLYPQILAEESLQCEWENRGLLFVFATPSAMQHYAETDRLLRDEFGAPATRYDGEAVAALEPALKPGLAGGWHYETDAHLRPDKLMAEWRRALVARGVTMLEDHTVTSIQKNGRQATALVTLQGQVEGDTFVFATGALTPNFNCDLGCRLPIQPGKGYSITMTRPTQCPSIPLIFEEHRVAVTPMQSGYRLGSTMEFAGYDATLNRRRLDLLREGAQPYLHEPFGHHVQEEWFGWRPMTPDGLPIIDRSPAFDNVWIAAGHNMLGLSMAPATGKLIAEHLTGQTLHIDPVPYRVARF